MVIYKISLCLQAKVTLFVYSAYKIKENVGLEEKKNKRKQDSYLTKEKKRIFFLHLRC